MGECGVIVNDTVRFADREKPLLGVRISNIPPTEVQL